MKYIFKCKCGNVKNIESAMKEASSLKPVCKCGLPMTRVWSTSFVIPESMKHENAQDVAYANDLMKTLPTGRRRAIF